MRSEIIVLAVAAMAAAGCTASTTSGPKAGRTDPATLKATGEARNCLPIRNNVSTIPAGPNTIMFRTGANTWYRNDLRGTCNGLDPYRTLVFRVSTGQYCSLDLFDIVDRASRMTYGTCSLGQFTPVDVPRGTRF